MQQQQFVGHKQKQQQPVCSSLHQRMTILCQNFIILPRQSFLEKVYLQFIEKLFEEELMPGI